MKIAASGGSPNPGAMLDVESNDRGFVPPRIYLTGSFMQLNGTTPTEGTVIFSNNWSGDGSLGGLFVWKNSQWGRFGESVRTPTSYIKLIKNNDQIVYPGEQDVSFDQVSTRQQPIGDTPMWSQANPSTVFIWRKGWYFVSASCRMEYVFMNKPRYISIMHKRNQVTAVGFNNNGYGNVGNNVTLNTSTMIYCEENDEINLSCYTEDTATIFPSGLLTTQMSVTQLPTNLF
ncbi:MAG: hypothetical protein EOO85_13230 [Pedobacter sp.]|nr:MAG: hypothetical protein EOO85_13230 [Pedobacter sp.]